ncbi:MAG: hypothetical protein EGQ92_03180 [Lactobacillus ruminis]|jgi:hypothetical protein|nr:hypothetical protein [Ligilactobacillus ruminis]
MSFFVLTEKCRAANENRCKNTGKFQKASFSRLSASNALIQRKNKDDVSNFVRPRVKKQSAFAQFTTAELKCYNGSVWIINDKRRKFVIRTSFDWKH